MGVLFIKKKFNFWTVTLQGGEEIIWSNPFPIGISMLHIMKNQPRSVIKQTQLEASQKSVHKQIGLVHTCFQF